MTSENVCKDCRLLPAFCKCGVYGKPANTRTTTSADSELVDKAKTLKEFLCGISDINYLNLHGDKRKTIDYINDIIQALQAKPVQNDSEPKSKRRRTFRHNNGYICCGTLRIARADFDTDPTPENQKEILDDLCYGEPIQAPDNAMPDDVEEVINGLSEAKCEMAVTSFDRYFDKAINTIQAQAKRIEELEVIAKAVLQANDKGE